MGLYPMRCPKCDAVMLEDYISALSLNEGTCVKCDYDYYETGDDVYVNDRQATREEVEGFYNAPRPEDSEQAKAWFEEFRRMRERISVCRGLLRELDRMYAWYDEEIRDRNEFRDSIRRSGSGRVDANQDVMPFLAWLDFMDLADLARTLVNIAVYDPFSSDPLLSYVASRTQADHEKNVSEWREKRKVEEKAQWNKTPASEAGGSPSISNEERTQS